ncbi:MAG TPA: ATP-binding protein [Egibacteraceae bacterium]
MASSGLSAASAAIRTALRRVVVGYRLVGALWLALLVAIAVARGDLDLLPAVALVGVVAAWSAVTWAAGTALRAPAWLGADLLVSLGTILLPLAEAGDPSVHGGYPFSSVLIAAWARGLPGALTAAVLLSAAAIARAVAGGLAVLPEAVGSVLVYSFGAVVAVWGIGVIVRADAEQRRLAAALADERAERLRSQERAETAAALHDSVLQTLALLQRRADDPAAVVTLARSEERALRAWLAGAGSPQGSGGSPGPRTGPVGSFSAAVTAAAAEVEGRFGVRVDVVTVGEADLDDDLAALVAAAREAMANAAEHAGVAEVACYAEVADGRASVFVRDRGCGFDPTAVPADRRGLAESIVGRVERRGGTAAIRTSPGEGTEVELALPR